MLRLLSCGPVLSTLLVVGCGDANDGQLSPVANARTASSDCAALSTVSLPDVRITVATGVAASQEPSGVHVAHCKVQGVIGKEIQFEVLLPDEWNGRFVMGGGGGFAGSLDNAALFAVSSGYASASTDTGHQASGIQAGWALHNAERLANYGHVAVHRTAETAKAVVAAYYGRIAEYSYFFGCSNGGRQALMEAQRYPQDFDGIVAGAPAYDLTNIAGAFIKNIKAVFPVAGSAATPAVSQDNMALIDRAALEACDAGDGVRDGVIDTPTACRFSLASVKACVGDVAAADCLTRAQRRAIKAIYAPASDKTHEIYPGQPVGAENDNDGWRPWITGVDEGLLKGTNGQASSLQLAFGPEVFKYFVFGDPAWDYTTYDLSGWARDTAAVAPFLNADNPDLAAFRNRRGKLIIWHGWADPALNAVSTIDYYRRVQQKDPAAPGYSRLFLLPGVVHCGDGPGPDRVDWIGALTDWVERDKPPSRLVSAKLDADKRPTRTRPVCAYPQRAIYKGSGSTDEAQNFVCK
jgi:hypothetical protein